MEYSIRPYIYSPEETYGLLLIEINGLDMEDLNDIIDSCIMVLNGKFDILNWAWHISDLDIRKETTRLSYNSSFETEIPTVELLKMLVAYRDRLLKYENEQKGSL